MPTGEWHNKMESLFPEDIREAKFYFSVLNYNVCRRADILLSNDRTCEIQHSYISSQEIANRFNDWNKFGKEIIWIIDGNTGIDFYKVSNGNYLLIFKDTWKYKSFILQYDFILVNIEEYIYKIELSKIKNGMIELKIRKTLKETVEILKTTPVDIWDLWPDDNTIKSTLTVYQQGAGNGKTYGIWVSICENIDRKIFIILTKQHTAKTVIYEELKDQKYRFINGEEVFHIENIENDIEQNTDKHFVIKYINKKTKRECIVIIGTVDSFCYNLSPPDHNNGDFFKGIIDNIANNGATKLRNGYMRYAGQYYQLSKESEIWIDEVQDLQIEYLHAMTALMYETGCYINIVGDKLQSLSYSTNFLTSITNEGLPNIDIVIKDPINTNRRIKVTNMEIEINTLIDFKKYDLPKIECDTAIIKKENKKPIKIIDDLPNIYGSSVHNVISEYCDKIMKLYKYEVETNNRLPNDFLILFPIMKENVISYELSTKIQVYWINKYNEIYKQYVCVHKHTEGSVINTSDSVNATRIMSIRASKGDGRLVVFLLQITEKSLKKLSNNEIGLEYESHLHVALTRAKEQIYFEKSKDYDDDIRKRFNDLTNEKDLPNISKNINLDKILDLIDKNNIIKLLNKHNINIESVLELKTELREPKPIVDWGYHCIKFQTFLYNVILTIVDNKNRNFVKETSELFVKLKNIAKKNILEKNVKEFWDYFHIHKDLMKDLPDIPLCKFSKKPEYNIHYVKIYNTVKEIKKHILNNTLTKLNVYESIILTYLIELFKRKRYSSIYPLDIYNITELFHFVNTNKEQELLNNIDNVKKIIDKSGIKDYKSISWNIFKQINLDSKYKYFNIRKFDFPIIGNNKTDIIHIILKSSISTLNFWDIMIQILLERFLIYNPKPQIDDPTKPRYTDNEDRYKNKIINTYCFSLDDNSFIKIQWDWDNLLTQEIKNELLIALEQHYQSYHIDIYNYFNYVKEKSKEISSEDIDEILRQISNYPDYIIDFFKEINDKINDDEDYDYINNFETFNNKLNKRLKTYLKKYFGL